MKVYTYSEARQRLARVLDEARVPVQAGGSPLDVPGVETQLDWDEINAAIRESRERFPGQGSA